MTRALLFYLGLPLILTPLLILLGIAMFQERWIFHPEPLAAEAKINAPAPVEEIWVDFDDRKIHSFYFPASRSKTMILYFHGNAGNLAGWSEVAGELRTALRANVWIMDYPGFGKSEGHLKSEDQMNRLAAAFADRIADRADIDQVYIFGRSVGTGPASWLAAHWMEGAPRPPLAGLILETPFTSMTDLIHDYASWFPAGLMKYRFPNAEVLTEFRGPILILHGTDDEIINYTHAEKLAAHLAGRGSVTMIEVPGGHHNDLVQFPAYAEGLYAWWTEVQRLNATTASND